MLVIEIHRFNGLSGGLCAALGSSWPFCTIVCRSRTKSISSAPLFVFVLPFRLRSSKGAASPVEPLGTKSDLDIATIMYNFPRSTCGSNNRSSAGTLVEALECLRSRRFSAVFHVIWWALNDVGCCNDRKEMAQSRSSSLYHSCVLARCLVEALTSKTCSRMRL